MKKRNPKDTTNELNLDLEPVAGKFAKTALGFLLRRDRLFGDLPGRLRLGLPALNVQINQMNSNGL
jgi:hypothetical protein